MIRNSGFTDLRMSHAHGMGNDDSVWPSFTDIMTVIVMIFLMALVIILIRNVDLVAQLKETMRSEAEVAALQKTTEEQRLRLENLLSATQLKLTSTESSLGETQTQLAQTEEEKRAALAEQDKLNQKLAGLLTDIATLEQLRDRLTGDNETLGRERNQANMDLILLKQAFARLGQENAGLEQDLEAVRIDFNNLENIRAQLAIDLADLMQQNQALATGKTQAEQTVTSLNARVQELNQFITRLEQDQSLLETDKSTLTTEVSSLKEQMEDLVQRFLSVQSARALLEKDRDQIALEKQTLAEELAQTRTRYNLSVEQLTLLKDDLLKLELNLENERESTRSMEQMMVALKGDYVELEEKYNKLIRPARSPVGRYVVELRITKSSGINFYQIREPNQAEYRSVSLQQLHQRMDEIKQIRPKNIYTRIIIPDDSGLSYNEAWKFTNDILARYDYYHQ